MIEPPASNSSRTVGPPDIPSWAYLFLGILVFVLLIWVYVALRKPAPTPQAPPPIDGIRIAPTPNRATDEAIIDSIANLQKR